jgi:F0F1-type ATP synthase delta subunit
MQKYSRNALVAYIASQLDKGMPSTKLAKLVAAYLIETGKTADLNSVMRDAQEYRAEKGGVVELTVRSAHDLDAAQVAEVERVAKRQYPGAKKIDMHQVKDESVVGGANLQFANSNLDISIRAKLNKLRRSIATS